MKKTITKILSLSLVAVILVCSLVSCGKKLSGSYSAELELFGQRGEVIYTFSGKNVEATFKTTVLGNVNKDTVTGKYEIAEASDGTLEITFDFETENNWFKDKTVVLEEGEDYITLGTVKYTKAAK